MVTKVKFCGMMLAADAKTAVDVGASYIGAIFAGGPRLMTSDGARACFADAGCGAERVGVFGTDALPRAVETAQDVGLQVIQLHGDPRASDVIAIRALFGGQIWAAVRIEGSLLPEWSEGLFREADAVLLDAHVAGRLGGTGVTLDWSGLRRSIDDLRGDTPVVLAGGLTPANVARAIAIVAPDVVDVSSGVEQLPGVKDHDRMRDFMRAVQEAA